MAVPDAPTFRVNNISSGVARLVIDPGSGATSFKVYRDEVSPATTLLASGVSSVYWDTTAYGVGVYFYRVKGTNADGDSTFSAELTILAQDPVPDGKGTNAKRLNRAL